MYKYVLILFLLSVTLFAEGWQTVPAKGDVPSARYGHSVVQINNLYYFFGGFTSVRGTPDAGLYQYDASTQTFTKINPIGQLPPGMGSHSAVAYNGKMVVVGGARATTDNAMYVFDPGKKTWTKGTEQPFGARMSMAMAVQGSTAYLVGGCTTDNQEPSGELWKVDLEKQSFTQGPSMPWGGRYAALGFADTSNVYVYGGRTGEGEMGDFWSFDPKISAWSQLSFQNAGPNGRSNALYAYIGGTLFVQGGLGGSTERGSIEMGDIWELDMSVNPPKWTAGPTNGPIHNQAAGFMSVTAGVAERAAGSLNISVFGGLKDNKPVPMDKIYQYGETEPPPPPTTSVVGKIGVLGRGRFALYFAGFEQAQAKVTVNIQWTEDNAKLRLCALHIPWVIRDENPLSMIEDHPEDFVGDNPQSLTPYIKMLQEQSKSELELEEVSRGQILTKTFVNLKRGTLILLLQHCYGSKTARNVSFQMCSMTDLPCRFLFLFPIGEPDTTTTNACIMDMVQFPVAPVRWYACYPPGAVGKQNTESGTGFWKWTYQDQTPRMHFLPGFVRFYLP